MELLNTFVALEIGKKLMEQIRLELGLDEDNWIYYLEQTEMDNLGYGLNGIIK